MSQKSMKAFFKPKGGEDADASAAPLAQGKADSPEVIAHRVKNFKPPAGWLIIRPRTKLAKEVARFGVKCKWVGEGEPDLKGKKADDEEGGAQEEEEEPEDEGDGAEEGDEEEGAEEGDAGSHGTGATGEGDDASADGGGGTAEGGGQGAEPGSKRPASRSGAVAGGPAKKKRGRPAGKKQATYVVFCLATDQCKAEGAPSSVSQNSNSNFWKHMGYVHHVQPEATLKRLVAKETEALRKKETEASGLEANNPKRFLLLTMVLAHQILCLLPFTHFEKQAVRAALSDTLKPGLDPTWLHWRSVRHTIVEYHAAWRATWVDSLKSALASAYVPGVTWSVDLWTSKTSGEKYMGASINCFHLCSALSLHRDRDLCLPYTAM